MGSVNSHAANSTTGGQPVATTTTVKQMSVPAGDSMKSDNSSHGRTNESQFYTNFWQRLFRRTKSLDSETIITPETEKPNSPSNKFHVQPYKLENNASEQHTTPVTIIRPPTMTKSVVTSSLTTPTSTTTPTPRPLSMDSSDLRNNPYRFERKHTPDYGHHQFQITSLSNRKQRLIRSHHSQYQQNNNANNNNNSTTMSTTGNRNSSPPAFIHPIQETSGGGSGGNSFGRRRASSKIDIRNCNLSKRESKSQNYLHLADSPKMRYIRVMHAFASVPDLTKKPRRSALKGSRNNSVNRLVSECEPVAASPIPMNSDSFSLTPPTPVEIRHLLHFHNYNNQHASDISNTRSNIKPVIKMDSMKSSNDSDWSTGKYEPTINENGKLLNIDVKIAYSKYSPEQKRTHESSRRHFNFASELYNEDNNNNNHNNNNSNNNNGFVQTIHYLQDLHEVSVSRMEESIDEVEASYDYDGDVNKADPEDEEKTAEQVPRFHSKLLRRDSIEHYLAVNKLSSNAVNKHNAQSLDENKHTPIDKINSNNNNDSVNKLDAAHEMNFVGKESVQQRIDEDKVNDSDKESIVKENGAEVDDPDEEDDDKSSVNSVSVSESLRDDYSPKPLLTEVLSPALCAAGYGPVGHLLTRWLPQRNFCELLIGTNESLDTSEDSKWCRRKELLKELARTSSMYTEDMTHEMFMLRFSEFVEVQELEPCDRSADKPWIRLTPKDKALIRRELNDYKMAEMDVHQDSRQFTRFHPP
ncbi:unnamed protein product [Trichobilharzia szidati]|nr:unnamed protein product [Trichobilharzia szidati]